MLRSFPMAAPFAVLRLRVGQDRWLSMAHHYLEDAGFKTPEPEEQEHEHDDVLVLFTATRAAEEEAAAKTGPARVPSFGPGAPPAPQHQRPMETDDDHRDRIFNRPPLHDRYALDACAAARSPLDTVSFGLPTEGMQPQGPPRPACLRAAALCC